MARYQDLFRAFYTSKYNNRKLTWQYILGHCLLRAHFPSAIKEFQVSLFQAVVLLCFNSFRNGKDQTLDYKEIKERTGLPDDELARTLQSLACGKVRVLIKSPKVQCLEFLHTD